MDFFCFLNFLVDFSVFIVGIFDYVGLYIIWFFGYFNFFMFWYDWVVREYDCYECWCNLFGSYG